MGRNILDVMARDAAFAGLEPVVIDNLSNAAPGHGDMDVPSHVGSLESFGIIKITTGFAHGIVKMVQLVIYRFTHIAVSRRFKVNVFRFF